MPLAPAAGFTVALSPRRDISRLDRGAIHYLLRLPGWSGPHGYGAVHWRVGVGLGCPTSSSLSPATSIPHCSSQVALIMNGAPRN